MPLTQKKKKKLSHQIKQKKIDPHVKSNQFFYHRININVPALVDW